VPSEDCVVFAVLGVTFSRSKTAANLRAPIPPEIRRLAPSSGVDERAARPVSYKRRVEVGLGHASRARAREPLRFAV